MDITFYIIPYEKPAPGGINKGHASKHAGKARAEARAKARAVLSEKTNCRGVL